MKKALLICLAVLGLALPAWAAPGELKMTIGAGRVTLIADSVPVRTILQEWARVGQSKIVNGEKVMGGPVTLRLINVPEAEALDIVLRTASGYLAAPRPVQMANASQFDRIVVLATSRPTTAASAPTPMQPQVQPAQQPFPSNPAVTAPIVEDEAEPEEEQPNPNPPGQMPVTAPRPGPIMVSPNAPAGVQPPTGQQVPPQVPSTAPRPGVIQPQPQQPQQPPPPPRPIPGSGL